MSRDKQIEEMDSLTSIIWEANRKKSVLDYRWTATEVYNAGYRKASEVAREIFEEIDEIFKNSNQAEYSKEHDFIVRWTFDKVKFLKGLAELKTKYESEGEGCDIT